VFSTLVVGADGSETSAEAVRVATELARQFGAALHVVTAYKPKSVDTSSAPEEFRGQLMSSGAADALLDDQCARVRAAGVEVSAPAETGDAADAIVRVAAQEKADLIVVGNKGWPDAFSAVSPTPSLTTRVAVC
jgi:nucleotide-binding universal stress UspA family protein